MPMIELRWLRRSHPRRRTAACRAPARLPTWPDSAAVPAWMVVPFLWCLWAVDAHGTVATQRPGMRATDHFFHGSVQSLGGAAPMSAPTGASARFPVVPAGIRSAVLVHERHRPQMTGRVVIDSGDRRPDTSSAPGASTPKTPDKRGPEHGARPAVATGAARSATRHSPPAADKERPL